MEEQVSWFALRAFKQKVFKIKEAFEAAGWKTYMAMRSVERTENGHLSYKDVQIIPQLIFVRCPKSWLNKYKNEHNDEFMIYRHEERTERGTMVLEPAPIPEKEMAVFIQVTGTGDGLDIEYYGEVLPQEGERVRVTDGLYKGATGVVKRIKRDRKLLIAVEGVAVIAVSNIPFSYLEKIV